MMVFQVIGGHFYEDTDTVGIYTDKDRAIDAAKVAFAGQDWKRDGDRCFDFVSVTMVPLDKALAPAFARYTDAVFRLSKDD